ncbi:MAG: AAA family ATPase [Candidatus Kapabacteria bacterium]|nr:AAA family ATPase [Candidatus Kapabacteria bacterium]
MIVHSLQLDNLRSFKSTELTGFSKNINVLIGKNNSGKSTILKSINLLQQLKSLDNDDIRINENNAFVKLGIFPNDNDQFLRTLKTFNYRPNMDYLEFELNKNISNGIPKIYNKEQSNEFSILILEDYKIISEEPFNNIIFFSSKRFTTPLRINIGSNISKSIEDNFNNFVSKIDSLNYGTKQHDEYIEVCHKIFGKEILPHQIRDGKILGLTIGDDNNFVDIKNMGDGTIHILGLIYYLVTAKDKIFIIEEIENYLHPKALKDLLEIIKVKSKSNQFFITTHSNIVAQELLLDTDNKLFRIDMEYIDKIPTSTIVKLNNYIERFDCFREMGYELNDFNLWEAWLILEESSAETFINQYFIPWYHPSLIGKLRTISSGGISKVTNRLEALVSMFIYQHLTPIYKNKAWIMIDGDAEGRKYHKEFLDSFCENSDDQWNRENFILLREFNFEKYYPEQFQEAVDIALSDKNIKREKKKELLKIVIEWTESNIEEAKKQFAISAKEIIDILKNISEKL